MNNAKDSLRDQFAELEALLRANESRLLAMVRRRMDPALSARLGAEDILQEAFLLAKRRWSALREQPDLSPFTWLYRLVLDCLIEAWRREVRPVRNVKRDMPWPAESALQLSLGLVGTGTSPSSAYVREETRQQIHQALEGLRQQDREILSMRHFDQLSFLEIAQVLGVTQSAANVRYVRALEKLKTLWKQMNPDEG